MQTNLGKILSTLRGEGHYDGQVVVVTYYAVDYGDRRPRRRPSC